MDPSDTPAAETAALTGARRRRGRPPLQRDQPLSSDEIVATARRLAARDGLDALTIRAVADELHVAPTALYHHVGSKAELLDRVIERVWEDVVASVPLDVANPVEWLIRSNVAVRRAWLGEGDLARLAWAVAEIDDRFYRTNEVMAVAMSAAGFPDVGLAYHAIQTFTMGSIAVATGRASASAVFGRDPDEAFAAAQRQLDEHDAPPALRDITDARFDVGDERYFEAGLRALVAGLLAGRG